MEEGRHSQYGAATGIIAVVLMVVGFLLFGADIPDSNSSAQEWQRFYSDHQDRIQFGLLLVGLGLFFFLWFLGSLRDAIAGIEGGGARLAAIAFGGGIIAVAALVAGIGAFLAAALHPQGVDPAITRAFNDFGGEVASPGAAGGAALFGAVAVAGYRRAAFPATVAGISALAAIGQLLAYPVALTDHGAFAPDGELGLFIPFVTFAIAVLVLSGNLIARAGRTAGRATT